MDGWGRGHCPWLRIFYGGQLLTPGYQTGGFRLPALMLLASKNRIKINTARKTKDFFNKDVCSDPLEWMTM